MKKVAIAYGMFLGFMLVTAYVVRPVAVKYSIPLLSNI